jgi:hypothetical protein
MHWLALTLQALPSHHSIVSWLGGLQMKSTDSEHRLSSAASRLESVATQASYDRMKLRRSARYPTLHRDVWVGIDFGTSSICRATRFQFLFTTEDTALKLEYVCVLLRDLLLLLLPEGFMSFIFGVKPDHHHHDLIPGGWPAS